MKLTSYIWNLYKNSPNANQELDMFRTSSIEQLANTFDFEYYEEFEEDGKSESFHPYSYFLDKWKKAKISSIEEAKKWFREHLVDPATVQKDNYNYFFHYIQSITTVLYRNFPEYFFPWYFNADTYSDFLRFCKNFEINLPHTPPRNDQTKRIWFYFEICQTLHLFGKKYNITSYDLPGFVYHFGIKSLEQIEERDLPKPSRSFFLGAGAGMNSEEGNPDFVFLDHANSKSTNTWGAGSLNIRKGDIVLMYCVSPRKYFHSIWKAIDDSFVDPFGYYYYQVKVGFKKIKHITFKELKANHVFKNNGTVKAHMQGMNGRVLSSDEYKEFLEMIYTKGQNIEELPKLPTYHRDVGDIYIERDVEVKLVEPLLADLGFNDSDWIRQLPLRMGRQTKYYPDYAIKANAAKGKEKAKIILEAKYSISNNHQLEEAFFQARSYALRLQSHSIIIADKESVWLYKQKGGDFSQTSILMYSWNELTVVDNLNRLKDHLLG